MNANTVPENDPPNIKPAQNPTVLQPKTPI